MVLFSHFKMSNGPLAIASLSRDDQAIVCPISGVLDVTYKVQDI